MQLVIFITVSVKWKFSFLQIYAYLYIHLRIKHANFKYHIIQFIRRGIGIFTSQRFIALKKQISSYTLFDPVLVQTTIFMLIFFSQGSIEQTFVHVAYCFNYGHQINHRMVYTKLFSQPMTVFWHRLISLEDWYQMWTLPLAISGWI